MSEKLQFSIGVDLSDLEKGLDKASQSIRSFADRNKESFEKFGKSMVNIGDQFKFVSLAALGLGAASIKMASDFTESMNKVDVAFGQSSQVIKDFAKTSLNMFGISEGTALDMAALFGDMATSMGLPQQQAALMSTSLVGLAGDLASFNEIDIKQAMTALNGVFTGETESLKMLGIVMTEANLQQFAFTQGITKSVQEMTQAEKVQLRYAYVLGNTKNAQGDFARTGGGAANQMRVFTERLKEISTQLGMILLPYFTKLITFVNGLVSSFQEMNPIVQKVVVVVGLLVAAFAPLMVIVGSIITFLPQILAGFAALTGPIGLIVLGVVALTAAIVANWDTIKSWAQNVVNYFIKLYNESILFRIGIEAIILAFKNMFAVAQFVFFSLYNVVTTIFKNMYEAIKGVADLILSVLTFDLSGIKKALTGTFNAVTGNVKTLFNNIADDARKLFNDIEGNKQTAIQNVLTRKFENVDFSTKETATKKLETDVTNAVSTGVVNGLAKGGAAGGGAGRNIGSAISAIPVDNSFVSTEQPVFEGQTLLSPILTKMSEEAVYMKELIINLNNELGSLIMDDMVNTFSGIGDAIGNALATGGNVIKAIGNTIVSQMGKFISSMGDMLIKYGTLAVTKGKLDLAIATGGPVSIAAGLAAIGVGIALKAAGAAIGSLASGGGGSAGATDSYSQSTRPNQVSNSIFANKNDEVVFRIAGTDLLGVMRRAEQQEARIGG